MEKTLNDYLGNILNLSPFVTKLLPKTVKEIKDPVLSNMLLVELVEMLASEYNNLDTNNFDNIKELGKQVSSKIPHEIREIKSGWRIVSPDLFFRI